jgi:hypothetical protein
MQIIYYNEIQKVTNRWIWLLVATISIIFIYGITDQLIFQHPFGKNPAPDWVLLLLGLIPFSLLMLLYFLDFSFQLNEEGVNYQFYPFHLSPRLIKWEDIAGIYVRKYKAVKEYGGWGIRTLSFKKNIAYNISGNYGLQIELKNGKKILLGTQNPEDLEKIISQITHIK